jgi:predicted PurR-regulated permease PerM
VLYHQVAGLISELPGYFDMFQQRYLPRVEAWIGQFEQPGFSAADALGGVTGQIGKLWGGVLSGLLNSGSTLLHLGSLVVLTPVVTFYLLRDWDRLVRCVDSLLPRAYAEVIREQAREIDRTLASFVRGQVNVCVILGVFYALLLSLVGLKYSLLIGLLVGFLVIIPHAGTLISAALSLGIAGAQFGVGTELALIAGIFVLGQLLEGYVLVPRLVGNRVGLHPVWVIFGMLAGGALFGFVGVLLAIPMSAVIGVLARFALERYRANGY